MAGPLQGVRVVEFAGLGHGPFCGMLLADLGADVVRVDRRTAPTGLVGALGSTSLLDRGKRSIALDLKDPEDLAVAQELARRADVLVENFRPGGLARFGLDHATVSATNPAVVYASISGFGSGPGGAALPGYDLIVTTADAGRKAGGGREGRGCGFFLS